METSNLGLSESELGNRKVRERAGRSARELERLLSAFQRTLHFKERERIRLQETVKKRQEQSEVAYSKLQVILKNMEIYDQNLRKINFAILHLHEKETILKNKYQTLLNGATRDELIEEIENDISDNITREKLSQRRRLFLEEMDKTFNSMEKELLTLETYKNEMLNTQAEILKRRDKALHLQVILEEKRRMFLADQKGLESALDKSLIEEKKIISALKSKIGKLDDFLALSEEIDQLLFSLLTTIEISREIRPSDTEIPAKIISNVVEIDSMTQDPSPME